MCFGNSKENFTEVTYLNVISLLLQYKFPLMHYCYLFWHIRASHGYIRDQFNVT